MVIKARGLTASGTLILVKKRFLISPGISFFFDFWKLSDGLSYVDFRGRLFKTVQQSQS